MYDKSWFFIKNIRNNTYPSILHFQNLRLENIKNDFDYLSNILLSSKNLSNNNELTIITITNNKKQSTLEKQIENSGHNNFFVLGRNCLDWNFLYKIDLLKNCLSKVKTKFVLLCDSHDVLIINFNDIIDKFLQLKCEALFNSEHVFWPDYDDFVKHNNDKKVPNYISCKNKEKTYSYYNKCKNPMYLNSGVLITTKNYLKFVIDAIDLDEHRNVLFEHGDHIGPNDQPVFRSVFHKYYPDIILDYHNFIVQTWVGQLWNKQQSRWEQIIDMKKTIKYYHLTAKEMLL